MDCANVRELMIDLVRGRLEPRDAAAVRAHLAGCEACAHEEQAERLLDVALAVRLPPLHAPPALRQRIAARLEETAVREDRPARTRRPRLRAPALAAAAAVVVAGVGFVAGRAVQVRSASADRLADELVTDHLRAVASVRPPDVESSDRHEVKPWFGGRLDFAPSVPADRGELRLLGGSIGYVLDRRAAVITYALRRHRVTLIAFPRAGLAGFERAPADGPPLRLARRGVRDACWAVGDVGSALVSDVDPAELGRLADELAAEMRRARSSG